MSFTRVDGFPLYLFKDGLVHHTSGYATEQPHQWLRWCSASYESVTGTQAHTYTTCFACLQWQHNLSRAPK